MAGDGDKDATELAEERTAKSRKRTRFSEDRTLLANERTFGGWARTAMASIAVGLGFQALFKAIEPTWVAKSIASLFVVQGVVIIWAAWRRCSRLEKERSSNEVQLMRPNWMLTISAMTTLGGIALLLALWFLV